MMVLSYAVVFAILQVIVSKTVVIEKEDGSDEKIEVATGQPPMAKSEAERINILWNLLMPNQTHDHQIYAALTARSLDRGRMVAPSAALTQLLNLLGLPSFTGILSSLVPFVANQPLGLLASSISTSCPTVCLVNNVPNPVDQMVQACSQRCTATLTNTASTANNQAGSIALSVCLSGCGTPNTATCVATCGGPGGLTTAQQTACGLACSLLCPAGVAQTPLLTNPDCCITPQLICASKGTVPNQIANCFAKNAAEFSGVALTLTQSQQACNHFPAETCSAVCTNTFVAVAASRASCAAACSSLCSLTTDQLSFQSGVDVATGRLFCPAPKLPVCQLGVGSSAIGLSTVVQQSNCLRSCNAATFTAQVNRDLCLQACPLVPQGSCLRECGGAVATALNDAANPVITAATNTADQLLCNTACSNLCPA